MFKRTLQLLTVMLALTFVTATAGSVPITTTRLPECPGSVQGELLSHHCADFVGNVPATLTNDTTCAQTLRALLASTSTTVSPTPCVFATFQEKTNDTTGAYVLRRRLSDETKGKYKCKLDASQPFNLTDVTQSFVVDCEEIVPKVDGFLVLWICLGICGGAALFALLLYCSFKYTLRSHGNR